MDLKDSQRLFTRLAVDPQFRKAAFADSDSAAGSFSGLEKEVSRSARSLLNKRRAAVQAALTGTCLFLGPRMDDEFVAYAGENEEPRGVHRHRLDALSFARWILDRTRQKAYPTALLDLLSHETAPLTMWVKGRRFLGRVHRRHPATLLRMTMEGKNLATVPFRPVVIIWLAASGAARGYRWQAFSPW